MGLITTLLSSSCHVGRYFYLNFADINDYKRFPAREVRASKENTFHFTEAKNKAGFSLPEKFNESGDYPNLEAFLEDRKTTAFLIIRNDTILFEKFFSDFDNTSIFPSFSVAKSFVSALVGCAVAEGKIGSINDPVTKYLPEMRKNGFDRVSIQNLLNMRSGILFNEGYYNPFGEMAKFYYGKNLRKYTLELEVTQQPGNNYEYQSGNTQILAMILERSTGMSLPEYLEKKIWKTAGMEYDASWNYDSKKHKQTKAFCCLNARLTDFAKFGRLYLNKGSYNGDQVIPRDWIELTKTNTTNSIDSGGYPYHFHWRVLEDGSMFAKGILGQYIYIDPTSDAILIRFGKKNGNTDWIDLFRELRDQL